MTVDRDLLHLSDIIDSGEAILEFTSDGHDAFIANRMIRDAVIRNLTIIGEATKRLSPELRARHTQVAWRDLAGLRDVVIHRYDGVDHEEVWRIIVNDLRPLMDNIRGILRERGKP